MMMSDIEEDQGELFPVDADDEAYNWDEAEDNGIAPPGWSETSKPLPHKRWRSTIAPTSRHSLGVRHVSQARSQILPTSVRLRGSILCLRYG